MRRNPDPQVLAASGYYDLNTNSAAAEYVIGQAQLPADRVTLCRYESGHMLYLADTAASFTQNARPHRAHGALRSERRYER